MKLATLADGSRDGHLVVVSDDLSLAHPAQASCTRLQQLLDDWNFLSPQLQDLATTINQGKARHAVPFEATRCAPPLPRAYRVVVVQRDATTSCARPAAIGPDSPQPTTPDPASRWRAMERAASWAVGRAEASQPGTRLWPGVAWITDELPAGADATRCAEAVRLVVGVLGLLQPDDASPPRDTSPADAGAATQGMGVPRPSLHTPIVLAPVVVTAEHWARAQPRFVLHRLSPSGKASGAPANWPVATPPAGLALAAAAAEHPLPAGSLVLAWAETLSDLDLASWVLEPHRSVKVGAVGSDGEDLLGWIQVHGASAEQAEGAPQEAANAPLAATADPEPLG